MRKEGGREGSNAWHCPSRVERDEANSSRTFSVPVDPAVTETIFLRDDQKWVRSRGVR